MLRRIIRRFLRQPLSAAAVIVFAAVLAGVLCFLHHAKQEEQQNFEATYASVPVFFKVTDLDGSKVTSAGGIDGWIVELFTESGLKPNLAPYVKELHLRVSYSDDANWIHKGFLTRPSGQKIELDEVYDPVTLTGITSTYVAEELTEGWGGKIYWYEGYDESILASSDEFVCLVPEQLRDEQEMVLQFIYKFMKGDRPASREITRTFKVVGYYVDPGNTRLYCPYPTMEWLYAKLIRSKEIEEIGAILNDNNNLAELQETVACWFAKPNPAGNPTPWGKFDFEYYLYALDINDTVLRNLASDMKNSMRMNQLASAVVLALSAGAGFLTGFLVIRSRKREMALMRTLGTPNGLVFAELVLEQLLYILIGIALGGGYALWQPIGQLALFGGIYAVGLVTALLVFMRQNLLSTMKEDE